MKDDNYFDTIVGDARADPTAAWLANWSNIYLEQKYDWSVGRWPTLEEVFIVADEVLEE